MKTSYPHLPPALFTLRGRPLLVLFCSAIPLLFCSAHAQQPGKYGHYEVYDTDFFPRAEYAARREVVLEKLPKKSAMLVRSADVRNRSNDVDYELRQRNNLLYLTGVTEGESALLLVPGGIEIKGTRVREVLFVAERDASKEVWTGILMGPKVATQVSGISVALPWSQLQDILKEFLPSIETLYYDNWLLNEAEEPLTGESVAWEEMGKARLEKIAPDLDVVDAGDILNGMRAVKSQAEIEMMQKAIDISLEGHREAMRDAKPGMHEYELEAIMEYTFHRLGSEEPGYPSIVGSGPNTCILHYETDRRQSKPGELILMDCGAEYHGYSADVTRTFPISGTFSAEQRAIYDLVYEAQTAAIAECKSGAKFFDPHGKAVQVITRGLVKLGVMKEGDDVRKYFMHLTSHFLGMDVHDVSDRYTLEPGMILTVEPGIYIPEGSPCDAKWWNIGVRIEDDILVTGDKPVNLSGKLARSADDVEALMRSKSE